MPFNSSLSCLSFLEDDGSAGEKCVAGLKTCTSAWYVAYKLIFNCLDARLAAIALAICMGNIAHVTTGFYQEYNPHEVRALKFAFKLHESKSNE